MFYNVAKFQTHESCRGRNCERNMSIDETRLPRSVFYPTELSSIAETPNKKVRSARDVLMDNQFLQHPEVIDGVFN